MEFPARALRIERWIAALALAAALGAAWVEAGSPLARRIQEGKPWLAWSEIPHGRRLMLYDTGRRRLHVVDLRDKKAKTEEDEGALLAAESLETEIRSPRALWAMARSAGRGLWRGQRDAADAFLLALELRRAPAGSIQPARLSGGPSEEDLLSRLLADGSPSNAKGIITAEVLNAAGASGLAGRAAKMLRSKGVDVLMTTAAPPRERTLIYDRTGDFARAERTRAALGCASARAVSWPDPARAVDVSIVIGADCAPQY